MTEARAVDRLLVRAGEGESLWMGGVGVVFKMRSEETGGAIAVVEHPILPRTLVPPHVHHTEDELSYVIEGSIGARIGDTVVEAGPGSYLFKPRGLPHAFWNAHDEPARIMEIIWPGGFEHFFEELAREMEEGHGAPDPSKVVELAARYHNTYVMDWVPELEATYGVSVLHQGGR